MRYALLLVVIALALCVEGRRRRRKHVPGSLIGKSYDKPLIKNPCMSLKNEMLNRQLRKYIQVYARDLNMSNHVQGSQRIEVIHVCALSEAANLASKYQSFLPGLDVIEDHYQSTESAVRLFYRHNEETLNKLQPVTFQELAVLPFGCNWERRSRRVTCVFLTQQFLNHIFNFVLFGSDQPKIDPYMLKPFLKLMGYTESKAE
ncbi:unnamed protein product [Cylicocyclus nassatus]|uniref:Uncharacterized protein n=1 Tax=Cylicocyclus nassatus TaxID=53992 RepID=A0AA36DRC2_CYLNA|nr:unnamed protein product [Cylicocyclus nassatus]